MHLIKRFIIFQAKEEKNVNLKASVDEIIKSVADGDGEISVRCNFFQYIKLNSINKFSNLNARFTRKVL